MTEQFTAIKTQAGHIDNLFKYGVMNTPDGNALSEAAAFVKQFLPAKQMPFVFDSMTC